MIKSSQFIQNFVFILLVNFIQMRYFMGFVLNRLKLTFDPNIPQSEHIAYEQS